MMKQIVLTYSQLLRYKYVPQVFTTGYIKTLIVFAEVFIQEEFLGLNKRSI